MMRVWSRARSMASRAARDESSASWIWKNAATPPPTRPRKAKNQMTWLAVTLKPMAGIAYARSGRNGLLRDRVLDERRREHHFRRSVSRLCGACVLMWYFLWIDVAKSMHLDSSPCIVMTRSGLGVMLLM